MRRKYVYLILFALICITAFFTKPNEYECISQVRESIAEENVFPVGDRLFTSRDFFDFSSYLNVEDFFLFRTIVIESPFLKSKRTVGFGLFSNVFTNSSNIRISADEYKQQLTSL